jgi:nitroimidazol reductase NimA-like FMN-containing flavoprotein (pyridoxamine 5'-phosphate oxidase superfamily)
MDRFEILPLNKVRRSDRGIYDRAAIYALLDEAFVAHVGFIDAGRPVVLPMVYGRLGDRLYIHGAKAARFAKALAQAVPVCFTVTLVDGIVVARSAFHMSANYRSAVLHGFATLVTDPAEAQKALAAITDHMLPGRWSEARPVLEKELKATSVLRVDVESASMKQREGDPIDDAEDYELPIWAGIVPVRITSAGAQDDGRVPPGVAIPASVSKLVSKLR